jgi:hypothetical protein
MMIRKRASPTRSKSWMLGARRGRRRTTSRLLEEAYLNHAYPVKHKPKYCGMIKNFMTSGFLTRGKEPKGDLGGKGATPFPGEEAVMTVYEPPSREAPYI